MSRSHEQLSAVEEAQRITLALPVAYPPKTCLAPGACV